MKVTYVINDLKDVSVESGNEVKPLTSRDVNGKLKTIDEIDPDFKIDRVVIDSFGTETEVKAETVSNPEDKFTHMEVTNLRGDALRFKCNEYGCIIVKNTGITEDETTKVVAQKFVRNEESIEPLNEIFNQMSQYPIKKVVLHRADDKPEDCSYIIAGGDKGENFKITIEGKMVGLQYFGENMKSFNNEANSFECSTNIDIPK
jgi:hypothetical protein